MPDQPRRKSAKKSFSGSHQRSWLWGYHAVTETIRAGKWPIMEIYATQDCYQQSLELFQQLGQPEVPIQIVSADRLEQLVRNTEHQGIVARLGGFPYVSLDEMLENLQNSMSAYSLGNSIPTRLAGLTPLVVVCDRIQDAFNLGAILRCCEGSAVTAVIVGDHGQAEVTPHVVRSSSGAVNYVSITRADNLIEATRRAKQLGMQVVAADSNAIGGIWETPLGQPTILIVGSEAQGIQAELLTLSDHRLCIPMYGRVSSLNAAVATGILLYEIRRQQSEVR